KASRSPVAQGREDVADMIGRILARRIVAERPKERIAELGVGAGNECAHEAFPALEVMQDRGMRNAHVAGDVLQPEPFRALPGETFLRRIKDQPPGLFRSTADP